MNLVRELAKSVLQERTETSRTKTEGVDLPISAGKLIISRKSIRERGKEIGGEDEDEKSRMSIQDRAFMVSS